MSFNAKNLNYEMKDPTFLRKLKGEYGAGDSHRHERPIARPRKLKKGEDDDDEDGPTYVDAESNTIMSRSQFEAIAGHSQEVELTDTVRGEEETIIPPPSTKVVNATEDKLRSTEQQPLVEIGIRKKRKVAKIIDGEGGLPLAPAEATSRPEPGQNANARIDKKLKVKTRKAVKLSFDDHI